MLFYLGTHQPSWLSQTAVPLFLSAIRLRTQLWSNVARGRWALDSGGFSQITKHGRYTVPGLAYAAEVRQWSRQAGRPDFAAVQDWMCEEVALARSGLNVAHHQRLTIMSYVQLRNAAPDLPWLPVLQGWSPSDYIDHARQYRAAGIDLRDVPLVGVGSICRRQGTAVAEQVIRRLAGVGIRLHGFGMKKLGLTRVAHLLASADSLAWSFDARHAPPLPGHERLHRSCANCLTYALRWRGRLLAQTASR